MRTLKTTRDELALADKLRRVAAITRYDHPGHDEATVIAHAFGDIEACAENFSRAVAALAAGPGEDAELLRDELLNIGEMFRQMLKQMRVAEFYKYLPTDAEMIDSH